MLLRMSFATSGDAQGRDGNAPPLSAGRVRSGEDDRSCRGAGAVTGWVPSVVLPWGSLVSASSGGGGTFLSLPTPGPTWEIDRRRIYVRKNAVRKSWMMALGGPVSPWARMEKNTHEITMALGENSRPLRWPGGLCADEL